MFKKLFQLLRRLLRWRGTAIPQETIATTEQGNGVSNAEAKPLTAALRRQLERTIKTLNNEQAGNAWGQNAVYRRPWYLVIGAPGSGKTTALANSGIRFLPPNRLTGGAAANAVDSTPCVAWLADDAVVLDTAGRFATHDDDTTVHAAAWHCLLSLLKRYRKRCPINGVLMTVSVADLTEPSESRRHTLALQLRARIQDLYTHFGTRFPVYVLFTQCDLIPGFAHFFANLSREAREQVWGMTFPLTDAGGIDTALPAYVGHYAALERRLNDRLIDRVQDERDAARRSALYEFPMRFSALKAVSEQFLREVFHVTAFEARAMLRGVYFTSATQNAVVNKGNGYFLTRLLRDVVFREAGLAGSNLKLERNRRWLQRSAYAAISVLTLTIALLWLASYQNHRDLMVDAERSARGIQQVLTAINLRESQLASYLPALDALRRVPGGYASQHDREAWRYRLGWMHSAKLSEQAIAAYQRTLQRLLLPKLAQGVEQRLRETTDQNTAFEALRAYLMLADAKHFDAKAVTSWFETDWEQHARDITAEQRQRLSLHTRAMLDNGLPEAGVTLDRAIVENTQRSLSHLSSAQRLYEQLKRAAEVQSLPEYRLSDMSGPEGALVFTRKSGLSWGKGVPGLFTFDGYHKVFKVQIDNSADVTAEDNWILGGYATQDERNQARLRDDVRQLYFTEYAQIWDRLLADITVLPFTDMNRAVLSLNVLSNPGDSPLRKLLQAAVRETQLYSPKSIAAGDVPAVDQSVNLHFARLHDFVKASGDSAGSASLSRTISQLSDVNAYLGASVSALQSGQRPLPPTPQNAQTLQDIRQDAPRAPTPVNDVMSRVAEGTRSMVVGGSWVNTDWRGSVLPMCKTSIAPRYPFERGATQDVTREDFGVFFSAGGAIDAFFQRNLKDYVDTSRDPWQARSFDGARLPVSNRGLAALKDAAKIREVFFRSGGQMPSLSFELIPLTMDAAITRFSLDVDGQVLRYDHGPQIAVPMQWPGPRGGNQVNLEYESSSTGGRKAITVDGAWALLRLFDKARMQSTNDPTRFVMTFELEGHGITLELRASSVQNPFRLAALERFQCPEKL